MFSNKREYEPKFVFNKDRPEHNQFKTSTLRVASTFLEVSKDSTEVVCKTIGEVRMIFQFNVGIVSYWLGKSQVLKDMTVSPLVALDLLITKHSL